MYVRGSGFGLNWSQGIKMQYQGNNSWSYPLTYNVASGQLYAFIAFLFTSFPSLVLLWISENVYQGNNSWHYLVFLLIINSLSPPLPTFIFLLSSFLFVVSLQRSDKYSIMEMTLYLQSLPPPPPPFLPNTKSGLNLKYW